MANYVVLDLQTGTYFSFENLVLINWDELTDDEQEIMIEGSDTERVLLADTIGIAWSDMTTES